MSNIEGFQVYGKKLKNLDNIIFQACCGLLLLAGVYNSHRESTKGLWDADTDA